MKPIIKNKIKKLVISLACATVIVSTLTPAAYNTISEIKHKDNSTISQVDEYIEKFDVIDGYRHADGERLKHNGNEPIYIQIDNEFTKEQKETIKQALDFIFGLVGDINSNYKYEIVDNINETKYKNKVKIVYLSTNAEAPTKPVLPLNLASVTSQSPYECLYKKLLIKLKFNRPLSVIPPAITIIEGSKI